MWWETVGCVRPSGSTRSQTQTGPSLVASTFMIRTRAGSPVTSARPMALKNPAAQKGLAELRVLDLLRHLGQRLEKLGFGGVEVLEVFDQ